MEKNRKVLPERPEGRGVPALARQVPSRQTLAERKTPGLCSYPDGQLIWQKALELSNTEICLKFKFKLKNRTQQKIPGYCCLLSPVPGFGGSDASSSALFSELWGKNKSLG